LKDFGKSFNIQKYWLKKDKSNSSHFV
jgi:hypothetical protein